ncbi:MAG: MarR family transcriptional regulator [Proteobacteria bacterium]|nr:MarR family transcriptional regulator [Pseudomonadota bacterium]
MVSKPTKRDAGDRLLDEAMETFMQGAGKISSALLGMINRVGGQIYALLFLSEEPLSLDEIGSRLGVSKSNISINIRMLEEYGLVRKVWVKGSRKDYYAAERTYPKKVITGFLEKIMGTLTDAITTIERTRAKVTEAKVTLPKEERRRAEFMLGQLEMIGLFYYAANKFFDDFFSGKPINMELLQRLILNPENLQKSKARVS